MPTVLDDRKAAILCALVQEYIQTVQPVGSGRISNCPVWRSPRRRFAARWPPWRSRDYLFQPHTSAGRVPTAKAYRFFVNSVQDQAPAMRESDLQQVSDFFSDVQGEIILAAEPHRLAAVRSDRLDRRRGELEPRGSCRAVGSADQGSRSQSPGAGGDVGRKRGETGIDVASGTTSEVVADASRRLAEQVVGITLAEVGTADLKTAERLGQPQYPRRPRGPRRPQYPRRPRGPRRPTHFSPLL